MSCRNKEKKDAFDDLKTKWRKLKTIQGLQKSVSCWKTEEISTSLCLAQWTKKEMFCRNKEKEDACDVLKTEWRKLKRNPRLAKVRVLPKKTEETSTSLCLSQWTKKKTMSCRNKVKEDAYWWLEDQTKAKNNPRLAKVRVLPKKRKKFPRLCLAQWTKKKTMSCRNKVKEDAYWWLEDQTKAKNIPSLVLKFYCQDECSSPFAVWRAQESWHEQQVELSKQWRNADIIRIGETDHLDEWNSKSGHTWTDET